MLFFIQSDGLEVPKELVSSDIIKKAQDFSMYKNDDDGWVRMMELKKTVKVYSRYHEVGLFSVFNINTKKYKTPKEMTENKNKVNEHYKKTNPRGWWVNLDAEATICHEFGHVYDKSKNISNKAEWVSLAQKWVNEDNAPEYCDPKNSVGEFSGKHYGEAFAEAFANTIIHNGKDIPDYIYKYVKSVI